MLTGAGCSTESGIPDYRDAEGGWKRAQPVLFQAFMRDGRMAQIPARRGKRLLLLDCLSQSFEPGRRYREASDALDKVREALGELVVWAGKGHTEFEGRADQVLTELNEQFFRVQGNLDGRGFRDRHDYSPGQFTFVVKPQIRR